MSLWQDIQECDRLLGVALKESKERGDEMVRAEAAYYTAKAKAAFRMVEAGTPATVVAMAVKGMPEVCEAMSRFHAAQVGYENAREARNVYKKRIDTLREQYAREWGEAGRK